MNSISPYKYLVMYYQDNEYKFATTRLSIETFEDLLGQRVLKYWELDRETGVKR